MGGAAVEGVTEALLAIRDRWHTKNHPFFDDWEAGRLTLPQMGQYMAQHYLLVKEILRPYGVCYARAPEDVQAFIIENLAEEFGLVGEGGGAPKNHNAILLRWTETCGLSADDVIKNTQRLPELTALLDIMWRLAYLAPWQVWLAAQAAQESQQVGIQLRTVPALRQHYGFSEGDARIEWFEEHLTADTEHGRRFFELAAKYITDEALLEQCKAAVEETCKARWKYMDAVYTTFVGPLPERAAR